MSNENNPDIIVCDNCNEKVNTQKHGFYILTKEDDELCWCQYCFEDLWKEMKDNLWECDDFEDYELEENS